METTDTASADSVNASTLLSAGLAFSDRIEAILDGRVSPAGCRLAISCRAPQALFRSVLRDQAFDVSEFSLGSHIAAVDAGTSHYVGLPVFLSRAFRHGNLYVRADRGITSPRDLIGRRIGVADFHQTAAIWVRGILADEHGVERSAIEWITGGLSTPVLEDRAPLRLPSAMSVQRSARTLNALLEEGEIDGVISPTAPALFARGDPRVSRLWADYRGEELAYYRRTGIFPLMHILVLRRTCLESAPGLAEALYGAFDDARRLACDDLRHRDYPKIMSPWLMADRDRTVSMLGGDPWSYGITANRTALDAILRYAEQDGLTTRRLAPEDLFAPIAAASAPLDMQLEHL